MHGVIVEKSICRCGYQLYGEDLKAGNSVKKLNKSLDEFNNQAIAQAHFCVISALFAKMFM